MLITFSRKFAIRVANRVGLAETVVEAVDAVSITSYRLTWENDSAVGNVYAAITWARGRCVRFTLETRDSWRLGSRTSVSGRHMRKASWEAHRDVLQALFTLDSEATVKTALATYRGKRDFEAKFLATGRKNVGSVIEPRTMRQCSI